MKRPPSDQNGLRVSAFQFGVQNFIIPASTVGYTGAFARSGCAPLSCAKSTAFVNCSSPGCNSWLCFWTRYTLNGRMKSVVRPFPSDRLRATCAASIASTELKLRYALKSYSTASPMTATASGKNFSQRDTAPTSSA